MRAGRVLPLTRSRSISRSAEFAGARFGRRLGNQKRKAIGLALAFQTRTQVHVVADGRIVEALLGTHVAHAADPGIEADADLDGHGLQPLPRALRAPFGIEGPGAGKHREGGRQRLPGMVRHVHRRVPERHDCVAHVLVDGTAGLEHARRHARKEAVEEAREAVRVELLGDRREAADIHEHQRDRLHLAAQRQLAGIARELLDEGRRQIAAEGAAHLPAFGLAAQEARQRLHHIERDCRERRIDRIELQALVAEQVPRTTRTRPRCRSPAPLRPAGRGSAPAARSARARRRRARRIPRPSPSPAGRGTCR